MQHQHGEDTLDRNVVLFFARSGTRSIGILGELLNMVE
jgi:hypothetical protein